MVGDGEGERGPEEDGEGDAEFELGFSLRCGGDFVSLGDFVLLRRGEKDNERIYCLPKDGRPLVWSIVVDDMVADVGGNKRGAIVFLSRWDINFSNAKTPEQVERVLA